MLCFVSLDDYFCIKLASGEEWEKKELYDNCYLDLFRRLAVGLYVGCTSAFCAVHHTWPAES